MNILFIGDINGKIGRQAVAKILPKLKRSEKIDLVFANAENSAHGTGVTEDTLKELMEAGVDYFTSGDHAFDKIKQIDCYEKFPTLRPANYPCAAPGKGYAVVEKGKYKILLINLIGRVFMAQDYDCPFRKVDEILAKFTKKDMPAIIIDIHAEATSEKVALKHYLNGRASAVLGTHTHVMTADAEISKEGTAYITDIGMAGFADGCIGVDKEDIIKIFLTQIKQPHTIPEKGRAIFNAVLITIDPKTGKAKTIKPIIKTINIE
ncbi:MAG: TIGR00282 family metallophosphoesterase [Patescibacteria group bacterium]|nr:TIGR00282 family metallophosphoesterase [Patescibacteria group bacterium]